MKCVIMFEFAQQPNDMHRGRDTTGRMIRIIETNRVVDFNHAETWISA